MSETDRCCIYNACNKGSLLLDLYENDDERKRSLNQSKYIAIYPTPGYCVKVKTNTGEKVFINLCMSPKIRHGRILPEKTFGENVFYFPACLSKRLETDNGGKLCTTFDVVMNDEYFHDFKHAHEFIIPLIMSKIEASFGLTLDHKSYTVLKNRKVMGTLQTHYSLDATMKTPFNDMKPLIQEISSSSKTVCDNTITAVQSQNKNKESTTCNYVILKEPLNGITNNLIGLFQIPFGVSSKDLIVLVDADSIVITNNENKLLYNICVPYTLNTDRTESFFDKDLMILRLNMPVHKE